jgi:hypothetical protein
MNRRSESCHSECLGTRSSVLDGLRRCRPSIPEAPGHDESTNGDSPRTRARRRSWTPPAVSREQGPTQYPPGFRRRGIASRRLADSAFASKQPVRSSVTCVSPRLASEPPWSWWPRLTRTRQKPTVDSNAQLVRRKSRPPDDCGTEDQRRRRWAQVNRRLIGHGGSSD